MVVLHPICSIHVLIGMEVVVGYNYRIYFYSRIIIYKLCQKAQKNHGNTTTNWSGGRTDTGSGRGASQLFPLLPSGPTMIMTRMMRISKNSSKICSVMMITTMMTVYSKSFSTGFWAMMSTMVMMMAYSDFCEHLIDVQSPVAVPSLISPFITRLASTRSAVQAGEE